MREWMSDAACRDSEDPELWFPIGTTGSSRPQIEDAKKVCNDDCPVKGECLAYALDLGISDGIWGGATEDERKAMRRNERRRKQHTGAYGSGVPRGSLMATDHLRADLVSLGLTAAQLNAFAGPGEAVDESTIRDIICQRRKSVYSRTYGKVAALVARAQSAVTK